MCHPGSAGDSSAPAASCCTPAACRALGSGPANLQGQNLPNAKERKSEMENKEQIISLDQPTEKVFLSVVPLEKERTG